MLANYRLHTQSKTSSVTDAERLEQAIAVSRRYWGSPFSLQYWQILVLRRVSSRPARAGRADDARGSVRIAHGQGRRGVRRASWPRCGCSHRTSCSTCWYCRRSSRSCKRVLGAQRRDAVAGEIKPQTRAWFGLTSLYSDGWAGPSVGNSIVTLSTGTHTVGLEAATLRRASEARSKSKRFSTATLWGRQATGDGEVSRSAGRWRDRRPVRIDPADRQQVSWFRTTHFGNQDYRPLSYRPSRLWFDSRRAFDGHFAE